MLGLKQKKVLKVYSDHIGKQEAEISQLISNVTDYRKKFGDIEISESSVSKKADLEKQLQEVRRENQTLNMKISTKENELQEQEVVFKDMDEALQNLTSQNTSEELSSLQTEVKNLEQKNKDIDNKIREIEDELNTLLTTRKI